MNPPLARIAVFAPLRALFDYRVPDEALPGMRVRLPFGRSQRIGIILELTSDSEQPTEKIKPVDELIDAAPLLEPRDLDFLRWAAAYYQHPPGEVFAAALPALLRKGKPVPQRGRKGWQLNCADLEATLATLSRAPRQKAIVEHLWNAPEQRLTQAELSAHFGSCGGMLKRLEERDLVEAVQLEEGHRPHPATPGPPLSAEQQRAVETILHGEGFNPCLLDGITGSGKTEVYLAASRAIIDSGRQVLVLVPEISLTPQTTHRFSQRLGLTPLVLHSALSDSERASAWYQASLGQVPLVLGTRSAIFTPLPRLGLVIVDEEHDLSFKQQEGFRYSARDLALVRASRAGCAVVLGSATPSLESLLNATSRRFQTMQMNQRPGEASPPRVQLLDIRSAPLEAGLSAALQDGMRRELDAGNQVLLFLNRRGYAPVLICHDCGWIAHCAHCDARMTVHRGDNRLCCHHCGNLRRIPLGCPECEGHRLVQHGIGTEQLHDFLNHRFADYPSVRIDRDSTRRKDSLQQKLDGAHKGEQRILLGTQMLAKGHDFPEVTLVGMVDVDQGLFGADFRATERMAQLITQVAGRAGRAERPGRVLIQTRQPDHPLLLRLIEQGYRACARELLEERRQAQLPPYSYQALLRADARQSDQAEAFMQRALQLGQTLDCTGIEFWGPAPAAMERRAGRHRQQLLLQSLSRPALQAFLKAWLEPLQRIKGEGQLRWSIDVDPQETH